MLFEFLKDSVVILFESVHVYNLLANYFTVTPFRFGCLFADDGKILKVVSVIGYNVTDVKAILTEELHVIEGASIRKLSIVRPSNAEPSLLVVSDLKITSIPLQRCDLRKSCK